MKKTILLVEDEEQVRTLLKRVLGKRDYEVVVAQDGREGLEKGLGIIDDITMVVTDLIMPELNGIELLRALRAQRPNLPCLFMTGYSKDDIEEPLDDAHLIQKPFTPVDLLARIEAILVSEAASS